MQVRELIGGEEPRWDEYVARADDASVFHHSGWRSIIQDFYRHQTHYLIVEEGNKVHGILPLFAIRSQVFGSHLRSLSGGISAVDSRSGEALLRAAMELADHLDSDYLSLRESNRYWNGPLVTSQLHCNQRVPLAGTPEEMWAALPHRVLNRVRKARRCKLEAGVYGRERVTQAYHVLAYSMRSLGTPIFSHELLLAILDQFPEQAHLLMVTCDGEPVATMVLLWFKGVTHAIWAGSIAHHLPKCPNDLLYWEAIRWSCCQGSGYLDLGRSQHGTGLFRFKTKWGAQDKPVFFQYYLRRGVRVPDLSLRSHHSLPYRLAGKLWQRLPLQATCSIGPRVRRYVNPLG